MRWRFRVHVDASPDDVEKLVLPAIIFVNHSHPHFNPRTVGFSVFLGWWHWSISFQAGLYTGRRNEDRTEQSEGTQ